MQSNVVYSSPADGGSHGQPMPSAFSDEALKSKYLDEYAFLTNIDRLAWLWNPEQMNQQAQQHLGNEGQRHAILGLVMKSEWGTAVAVCENSPMGLMNIEVFHTLSARDLLAQNSLRNLAPQLSVPDVESFFSILLVLFSLRNPRYSDHISAFLDVSTSASDGFSLAAFLNSQSVKMRQNSVSLILYFDRRFLNSGAHHCRRWLIKACKAANLVALFL